jgi:bifunctional oligoribonuclease and PAP phosphatase NrnA
MLSFKICARRIWKEIDRSQTILLHLHPSPDGDSIGSALAFYHALTKLGKNVTLIQGDSSVPQNLSHLPGTNKITPQNINQIDLSTFDLFLILDSSSISYVTKSADFKLPKKLKTIVIDHHQSNGKFGKINMVIPNCPATAQIIYELLTYRKIKITPQIAACIYVGIYTDSGGFRYFNPTYKTFNIASHLAKIYPKFSKLIFNIENSDSPDRLKFISLMFSSIKTFYSDHVAVASISYDQILSNHINIDVIGGYSEIGNSIKSVIGWDIAVTLVELQPNMVKVSLRTRDSEIYDLSKIALATKAGGGHKAAAGATLNMSLEKSQELILSIIKKLYPKIDQKKTGD